MFCYLFLLLLSHPFRDSASPPVVIDASELGDLLALSSASHSFGVETPEEDSDQVIEDCGQCITYPIYVGSAEEPPLDDDDLPDPEGLYFDLGDFSFNQIWTYRRASDAPEPGYLGDISNQVNFLTTNTRNFEIKKNYSF